MLPAEPALPTDAFAAPIGTTDDTAAPLEHSLPIVFTGSGSEYFRIWSVNLLLMLLTVGLYLPWAKVRRLRYFYGNTLVGDHPLDFHGQPRRMLRGFLLVGVLVALYTTAGNVSPGAGLAALGIVAAVWPALFRASQQFRLANTSWRGLRFQFTGGVGGAYRAMLPLFVPGLLVAAVLLVIGRPVEGQPYTPSTAGLVMLQASVLLPVLLFPLLWWLLKKYQHDHYRLGQAQTQLRASAGAFYKLSLKVLGVSLLAVVLAVALAALLAGISVFGAAGASGAAQAAAGAFAVMSIAIGVYAALVLMIRPYAISRMQNLVWNRTQGADIRFESALRYWPFMRLTLKNWLLVLLTLGLYWPFAAIATTRMRLQAVTVHTRMPPEALVNPERRRADDATGDAAGDLFGIDVGL